VLVELSGGRLALCSVAGRYMSPPPTSAASASFDMRTRATRVRDHRIAHTRRHSLLRVSSSALTDPGLSTSCCLIYTFGSARSTYQVVTIYLT
jgi:hypothetical protein